MRSAWAPEQRSHPRRSRKPRVFRAWMLAPVAAAAAALLAGLPSSAGGRSRRELSRAPLAGAQEDYRRAHDLLAHYYRPQALETAIPLLEKIVAQDPRFAPAFADLGRANLLQFTQQRDTKYIEPARESSLRALALAPDLASAHVTLGALVRAHGAERPREPRTGGGAAARQVQRRGVRCAGGAVRRVKVAPNWWSPRSRKPSAWPLTTGAWSSSLASTISTAASGLRRASSTATRQT